MVASTVRSGFDRLVPRVGELLGERAADDVLVRHRDALDVRIDELAHVARYDCLTQTLALLACAAVHHHLIREGTRTQVSLVLESGEPREVMHFALLIGYGASAVN